MAKKDAQQYKVLRSERITQGETVYDLVAGTLAVGLPDDLVEVQLGRGAIGEVSAEEAEDITTAEADAALEQEEAVEAEAERVKAVAAEAEANQPVLAEESADADA